ncbi:DUF1707 domain-containing protein [Kribbella sp. NBC_01245]|uniref:DUF1707 SHOCT-like domain-containing protein n=1 Tax=Kribbella sp. NBC_01245 TaxID=2903578 RepID=UPI002E27CF8B|nr:DUF1707 domain-containing protein [Kribbella sp. NBC_01245]
MSQHLPSPSAYDVRERVVRIGDAERDEAVALLGEHFVAGRLTQEEFEERSDQATRARYVDDVAPLFADLPDPETATPATLRRPDPQRFRAGPPPRFLLLAQFLMVGLVVATIALGAPWLLWMFFWFALFSGPHHRRHHWRVSVRPG